MQRADLPPPPVANPPRPLRFPTHATMPETKRHLELRTLLYTVLKHAYAHHASIGCDQFVYWDASNPKRCLAPDAFVRLGTPDTPFPSWKTWERGAPELAVEIVSDSDSGDEPWDDKLSRYHALGVEELVRFDPSAPVGKQLRVWDRIDGDLVERAGLTGDAACRTLRAQWVVTAYGPYPHALRLADEGDATRLVETPEERAERAERRIAELEAELRRRNG